MTQNDFWLKTLLLFCVLRIKLLIKDKQSRKLHRIFPWFIVELQWCHRIICTIRKINTFLQYKQEIKSVGEMCTQNEVDCLAWKLFSCHLTKRVPRRGSFVCIPFFRGHRNPFCYSVGSREHNAMWIENLLKNKHLNTFSFPLVRSRFKLLTIVRLIFNFPPLNKFLFTS